MGGIVILSSWIPLRNQLLELLKNPEFEFQNKTTPIFIAHGESDNVLQYKYGVSSKDFVVKEVLQGEGDHVKFHSYPGLAHSSCQKELDDLTNFLKEQLSQSHNLSK